MTELYIMPVNFIPTDEFFIDIEHEQWRLWYKEALAMGCGEKKAQEWANKKEKSQCN